MKEFINKHPSHGLKKRGKDGLCEKKKEAYKNELCESFWSGFHFNCTDYICWKKGGRRG